MLVQWNTVALDEQVWLISQVMITLIMIVMLVYFLVQVARLKDVASQRHFYTGLALFVTFNTATQVIWTFDKFALDVLGMPAPDGSVILDFWLPFIGGGAFIPYLFLNFSWSFAAVSWPVEKHVRNSKRFPITTINVIGASLLSVYILVIPWFFPGLTQASDAWEPLKLFMHVVGAVAILGVVFGLLLITGFYMVLGARTGGIVRKKSLLIAFGFVLVFTGLGLTQVSGAWSGLASAGVMIIGFLMLGTGYRIRTG